MKSVAWISLTAALLLPAGVRALVRPAGPQPRAEAASIVFTGTVTRQEGGPLPATVVEAAKLKGRAVTNAQGRYTLSVSSPGAAPAEVTLTARSVGYQTVTRQVPVSGDTVRVDFQLVPEPDL